MGLQPAASAAAMDVQEPGMEASGDISAVQKQVYA